MKKKITLKDARFVVRATGIGKGKGLFATSKIKKGSFVIEYTGDKIPTKVADTLGTRYLFEIDSEWTIDGASRTNTARYINHSCDPNCEVEIEGDRLMIYAVRNIARGEELSFDYGEEYFDDFIRPSGCKCHTKLCRKPAV
jgi:SET domain-containing protein